MEEISRILLLGVAMLAAVLLFTPYEAVLDGVVAIASSRLWCWVSYYTRAKKCFTSVLPYDYATLTQIWP